MSEAPEMQPGPTADETAERALLSAVNRDRAEGAFVAPAAGTLILLCGPPCSGKTTLATALAARRSAVRLCPDDWVAELGLDQRDELRENVYPLQWTLARQVVLAGANVVVDSGHWMREERDTKRSWARQHGARVELHYLDVPLSTLVERAGRRTAQGAPGSYPLRDDDLLHWHSLFEPPTQAEQDLFEPPRHVRRLPGVSPQPTA